MLWWMFQNSPIRGLRHADLKSRGHEVSVRIVNGAIGQRNLTINIVSRPRHGINSNVTLYG